jgi:hypothetical protein
MIEVNLNFKKFLKQPNVVMVLLLIRFFNKIKINTHT